jgi:hypothetical protein
VDSNAAHRRREAVALPYGVVAAISTGAVTRVAAIAGLGLALAGGGAQASPAVDRAVPTLAILAPHNGQEVVAPFAVRYRITGFDVGNPPRKYMHVYTGKPGASFRIELPLSRQAGRVTVPDHPMLSGRRNLTFVLARANHQDLRNAEARSTVYRVLISGSR